MGTKKKVALVNFDGVKEIFGKPRGWMLYWGNVMIFGVVGLLLFLATIIKYPDEVQATVFLTRANPPILHLAPKSESIERVFVQEGAAIQKGEPLLLLGSSADYTAMQQLDTLLAQCSKFTRPIEVHYLKLPENLACGELRTDYAILLNYHSELSYWLKRSRKGERFQQLDQQFQQLAAIQQGLAEQLNTLREETEIAQRNFEQFKTLAERDAASQIEVDQAETVFLRTRRQFEQQEQNQQQNLIAQQRIEAEKTSLTEQFSDQINEQWLGFKKQTRLLRQGFTGWQEQHILAAAQNGQVAFIETMTEGKFLPEGTPLFYINPENTQENIFAEGLLPATSIGKINVGSTANIQLLAYPYREFGQVSAVVEHITFSPQPTQSVEEPISYRVKLALPEGLVSSYKKELAFRPQLAGTAIIVSKKRSLFSRILDRFRAIRDRNF